MKRRIVAAALSVSLIAGAAPAHAGEERPVDQASSIKPIFELSSPSHSSEHSSFADDEDLRKAWGKATRMGFFSPLIESIYKLEIPTEYETPDIDEDENEGPVEKANWEKYQSKESLNKVLGSSLKWDAARGNQLGVALNWWITAGVLAGLLGGVFAANQAGLIQIPSAADLDRMHADARRQLEALLPH
mgnify:FL=1